MTARPPLNTDGLQGLAVGGPTERPRKPVDRTVQKQTGLVVGAVMLSLLVGIAGVPGVEEPEAGDGSVHLKRGWAEQWTRTAESATVPVHDESHDPGTAEAFGLDPAAQKR